MWFSQIKGLLPLPVILSFITFSVLKSLQYTWLREMQFGKIKKAIKRLIWLVMPVITHAWSFSLWLLLVSYGDKICCVGLDITPGSNLFPVCRWQKATSKSREFGGVVRILKYLLWLYKTILKSWCPLSLRGNGKTRLMARKHGYYCIAGNAATLRVFYK